jgi:hypothetical protein
LQHKPGTRHFPVPEPTVACPKVTIRTETFPLIRVHNL